MILEKRTYFTTTVEGVVNKINPSKGVEIENYYIFDNLPANRKMTLIEGFVTFRGKVKGYSSPKSKKLKIILEDSLHDYILKADVVKHGIS